MTEHEELVEKYGSNYSANVDSFSINKAEQMVIDEWLNSLVPEILAIQKAGREGIDLGDIIPDDQPYYGAVGGGVTYSFLPTGLGTILIVKESSTGKELNVTDALGWFFYG